MLKIDRNNHTFFRLESPTLAAVSIMERYDLQEFIANSPEAFFTEIGQTLFVLGKEIEPSQNVQDRIDLLAVDKDGVCVIVELKRGNDKLHMLQAISYAGMISHWTADDLLQLLDEEEQEALSEFLDVDREEINQRQRIILIAEAYDYALLVGAEWLSEQHGVGIACCRIAIAKDSATNSEYLVCSNVYPAPELAKEAISRGRKRGGVSKLKWPDWQTALLGISNPAVVSHFRQELAAEREAYLRRRHLRYRYGKKLRWWMAARNKNAYVWQNGRFDGDIEFWQNGLSKADEVGPINDGKGVRLFLYTDDDFRFFQAAATEQLQSRLWLGGLADDEITETEAAV